MLDPYSRLQLVNELRPPSGYEFHSGIGTTFSLDLESLLTVPLSLALCEFESREEALSRPEAVLEGLRRIAGKLHLFCQRGRIKRPKEDRLLFSLIEKMVIEAMPPDDRASFHPKVWVLRYRRAEETLIRVLVLSRNLTFDKSWDTALVLEGQVQAKRERNVQRSERLAQFLRALPGLSIEKSVSVQEALTGLANDVSKVEFEDPDGFEKHAFWPLGIGATEPKFLKGSDHSRLMVISPFLSDLSQRRGGGILEELLYKRSRVERNVLISRADQLDRLLPESLAQLLETTDLYVLDEAASQTADADEVPASSAPESVEESLSGLHAKVFVIEDGAEVSVVTGSANATLSAWGRNNAPANVEFVVELTGPRKRVGINAILGTPEDGETGTGGLAKILKPYRTTPEPVAEDKDVESVARMLDTARRQLAIAAILVDVSQISEEEFKAVLSVPAFKFGEATRCSVWPIMLRPGQAKTVPGEKSSKIEFSPITLFALTPFWAFRLVARSGDVEESVEFVLKLPLNGLPEHRNASIMARLIDHPDRFMRYLALLLADDPSLPGNTGLVRRGNGHSGSGERGGAGTDPILLENLLLAYSRSPERLDRIDSLLNDLASGAKTTASVIPEGFEEIWQAFRVAK